MPPSGSWVKEDNTHTHTHTTIRGSKRQGVHQITEAFSKKACLEYYITYYLNVMRKLFSDWCYLFYHE